MEDNSRPSQDPVASIPTKLPGLTCILSKAGLIKIVVFDLAVPGVDGGCTLDIQVPRGPTVVQVLSCVSVLALPVRLFAVLEGFVSCQALGPLFSNVTKFTVQGQRRGAMFRSVFVVSFQRRLLEFVSLKKTITGTLSTVAIATVSVVTVQKFDSSLLEIHADAEIHLGHCVAWGWFGGKAVARFKAPHQSTFCSLSPTLSCEHCRLCPQGQECWDGSVTLSVLCFLWLEKFEDNFGH